MLSNIYLGFISGQKSVEFKDTGKLNTFIFISLNLKKKRYPVVFLKAIKAFKLCVF